MYVSEAKRNETLNGTHFHTASIYMTENKKTGIAISLVSLV